MKIEIKKNGRKIKIEVIRMGFFRRGIGLMFRGRNTKNLLFEFNKDVIITITSYFCFFPFLVVWLDSKNNVVESKIIRPFVFSIRPSTKFRKLVEIPVNDKNKQKIAFFVGKHGKI